MREPVNLTLKLVYIETLSLWCLKVFMVLSCWVHNHRVCSSTIHRCSDSILHHTSIKFKGLREGCFSFRAAAQSSETASPSPLWGLWKTLCFKACLCSAFAMEQIVTIIPLAQTEPSNSSVGLRNLHLRLLGIRFHQSLCDRSWITKDWPKKRLKNVMLTEPEYTGLLQTISWVSFMCYWTVVSFVSTLLHERCKRLRI